jgi:hypothetical protein
LAIVFDMKLGGRELGIARAAARHGGYHHAVSELKSAKHVGCEERRVVRLRQGWCSDLSFVCGLSDARSNEDRIIQKFAVV